MSGEKHEGCIVEGSGWIFGVGKRGGEEDGGREGGPDGE